MGVDARGRALGLIAIIGALVLAWDRHGEQFARAGDVVGADAACEQSVMADAVKTCWQDMDEEAADELAGREPHDLLPRGAIDAVILVFERDAGVVAGKQAAVGDGDAVGIARQIGQHSLRAAEGTFAVDHPFDPARWRQIFREGIAVREVGVRAKELPRTRSQSNIRSRRFYSFAR
jgi:hypothetical protein